MRRSSERESPFMPIRSLDVTAAEAAALRELSNRFPPSPLARKAAINAVRSRCARLVGAVGKDDGTVLCRGSHRIDARLGEPQYLSLVSPRFSCSNHLGCYESGRLHAPPHGRTECRRW